MMMGDAEAGAEAEKARTADRVVAARRLKKRVVQRVFMALSSVTDRDGGHEIIHG
jgi:hypothetical protein